MVKFKVIFLLSLLCIVLSAMALVVLYGLNSSREQADSSVQTIAVAMKADGCVAFNDQFNSNPKYDYEYFMPVGKVEATDYIYDGDLKVMSPGTVYGPQVGKNFTIATEVNSTYENPFTQGTFGVNSIFQAGEKTPEWDAYITIGYFEGSEPVLSFVVREAGKQVYKSQPVQVTSLRDEVRIAIVKEGTNVSAHYVNSGKEVRIGKHKLSTERSAGLYPYMTSTAFASASMDTTVKAGITGGTSFDFLKVSCAKL